MQMCINCVETICLVSVKARGIDGYESLEWYFVFWENKSSYKIKLFIGIQWICKRVWCELIKNIVYNIVIYEKWRLCITWNENIQTLHQVQNPSWQFEPNVFTNVIFSERLCIVAKPEQNVFKKSNDISE